VGLLQQQLAQQPFEPRSPAPQPGSSNTRMAYGLSVVGGTPRERFVEQRGSLALPISAASSIQEATRVESNGPGLEFATTLGASVRAVAAGRVAFSDRYGSYGQLVILDHGDRYYSVYGGFGSVEVQVGDEVSKSARLGTADSAPVYFEVRRGTKAENARSWLGI
jgi:septal ring factor EnvC (AmiA/AmiB activator)